MKRSSLRPHILLALFLVLLFTTQSALAVVGMDAFVSDPDSTGSDNVFVPVPEAYEVYSTIKNLGDAGFMNHPEDLFVAPDDTIYVADGENNRVLQMTRDGNVIREITEGDGVKLKKPRGVYVHPDGSIWIADTGNLRIVTLNSDLTDRKTYVRPDSSLLGSNFTFDVQKIFVANTGYIYALKGANLLALDEANNFRGYLGADKVGFSLSRFLIRLFGTKSQIERTVKQEPASYSNFFIGSDNMIYGILSNKNTAQIRKLNSVGTNTYPEDTYGFTLPDRTIGAVNKDLEPTFSDITVEDNGIITVVDRGTGLIYQYDQDGNLLCCFGGLGDTGGLFQIPISIDADSEGFLYVLDYQNNEITVFKPTHFIELVHEAVTLHGDGRYDEALGYWQQALAIDSNYSLAHRGVAKIMGKQENWDSALRSYELARDKEGYSEAFAEYRHEYFRHHFLLVVVLVVVIVFCFVKLLTLAKRKADQWADDVQMGRGLD
ncbi:MAG: hypothetical protein IJ083_04810 [Clostridia bacterium]|nr:hypothetical protein [Clostridia bacterium]